MDSEPVLHQQLSSQYRALQPQAAQAIQHDQHGQPHLGHHTLESQGGLDLDLNNSDAVFHQELRLQDPNGHGFQPSHPFDHGHGHGQMQIQDNGSPHTPQNNNGGQFGILAAGSIQHSPMPRLQEIDHMFGALDGNDQKSNGHLSTKVVVDPPNLAEWRQRLFNVDEMITLSEDEFQTYFPHVDNVYSHRSTQRYKRKPFVSHYWDCRLKGRPPGTPKSTDPNKKKRKRMARERDLCDVKIKITEYFPGAMLRPDFVPDGGPIAPSDPTQSNNFFAPGQPGAALNQQNQFGVPYINNNIVAGHPGATGARYYTIQRVNGNGGNGKGDGVPGPHKHELAESDRVKKNSIQRLTIKKDKEEKKTQKTYHKKASGNALATVKKHSKEHELKLFGSCFCPFVQRVWIAMEAKGLQYQYIEVDPYKKPQALLEVNPRGLVPGIRHGDWGCGESTVLMEYLEDLGAGPPLLPPNNPQLRANCRLWSDHINRKIVPTFYHLLQAQEFAKQAEYTTKLKDEIAKIVDMADAQGPFFLGPQLSYVDIQFAPWIIRLSRVMRHYRGWPDPPPGSRWGQWLDAVENNEFVKNTTSLDDLYIDSYERYAQNRPNTSELADAVNGGYGLP
ncbi:related to glutathione transferase omega 1 [Rhynchosporium graminicola]|uniref:Related to glutathione transferase omega 1 n=1 Tax=Rhynchosporium graminicola TaxID=2792576 RepID=A0A1E1JXX0_9HELO|nr:related to glutathione transferase omega 1 [Rhynchosporium commune]